MIAAYVPLIDGGKQQEWEAYALDHQDWITESARLRKTHANHQDPLQGMFQLHEGDCCLCCVQSLKLVNNKGMKDPDASSKGEQQLAVESELATGSRA